MDIVKICPTCKESITRSPLVDILVTYQEDLTEAEIYEQGWHKKCYPAAPALPSGDWQSLVLAVLTEPINNHRPDFASDIEEIARYLSDESGTLAADLRAKAQAIRAAIAEARGEAG